MLLKETLCCAYIHKTTDTARATSFTIFSILLTLMQAVLSVLLCSSLRLNFVFLRQVNYVGFKK